MSRKQVAIVTKLRDFDLRPKTASVHRETLRKVGHFLKASGVQVRLYDRNRLCRPITADLILAIGGDGTAIATSHFADRTPLLGINSAPQTSIGFFCRANPSNFSRLLTSILQGRLKPKKVPRLEVTLNGKKFPYPGLNEVLLASELQGDTARYLLRIGHQEEEQKSSGVWVATGAGSTAVIRSAGGKKDSPFSKRLQYRVREPFCYPRHHYKLLHGFLKPGQTITLISQMHHGMIFMDGAKLHRRVPRHAKITVRGGMNPLTIFL